MSQENSRQEQITSEYLANGADSVVGEIFSGGVTVAEAIERLRGRLLDLSSRNRLLNYRHTRGRCVQMCDQPNVNLVFGRLMDGKDISFKYVAEPDPASYEGQRPDVKLHADRIGISTSFEFPPNSEGTEGRHLRGIQTLLYPAELERQLRKIASEAKSAIEETGTNMLFLVFGFLEFYESDNSDKQMLAPLLSLPVMLKKGSIDRDTRTYQYSVLHNGEDMSENYTLREKLRRDFMIFLPEYNDEEKPECYFLRIEQAVSKKRRWKLHRQITLGMLSFGKLAIWSDLDTKKNPGLLESELIKIVFSGNNGAEGCDLHAEDYRIDERPEATLPLIYDADSSQHSAIIDVLSGKNMVINGPPGTGKSQTITNIIATALYKGKKVLFVSEKLAALEVVSRRLDKAHLGHFCLELHSHKTQKKKFLKDIQTRIVQKFSDSDQFQVNMPTLRRHKTELARYAELMGSRIGNALGLTVNEVFWAAERRRQELGSIATDCHAMGFKDASGWTHDDIESKISRLTILAKLYDAIGGYFDQNHPWWGFWPNPLAPSDDEAVARIVTAALESAKAANSAAEEAVKFFGMEGQPDADSATRAVEILERIPRLPVAVELSLLPKLFDPETDPNGHCSSRLISNVTNEIEKARRIFNSAAEVLVDSERLPADEIDRIRQLSERGNLSETLLSADIRDALELVLNLEKAIGVFRVAVKVANVPYEHAGKTTIDAFIANCREMTSLGLASFPINQIASRASAVLDATKLLNNALSRINSITSERGIPFDGTPGAVACFADPARISGLSRNANFTAELLTVARRLAEFPLAERSIAELFKLKSLLDDEITRCVESLDRCRLSAECMGVSFDSSEYSITELTTIAKVCSSAPIDLLEYRRPTFGQARAAELIGEIKSALAAERDGMEKFDSIFYLDALPQVANIKSSVAVLRHKDGFFALFDGEWRKARKLHASMSKEKRKLTARQRAEELAAIASWIEAKDAFISNADLGEFFGGLFRGLETDPARIEILNNWYVMSRSTMAECPGLAERFDLTTVSAEKVAELSAKAMVISDDLSWLAGTEARVIELLGFGVVGFRKAKSEGWNVALDVLRRVVNNVGAFAGFFAARADSKLSPKDALRLMEIKMDIGAADSELKCLMDGQKILQDASGEELGWLVNLAGGPWADVLRDVSSQAARVAETVLQAMAFADGDCPLSVAESFAKAEVNLDEAWESVAILPQWNRFEEWTALINIACEDALSARTVLERISPYTRSGKSVLEFFDAADREMEARSILDNLVMSDEVLWMLGDVFDGVKTDLEFLSAIHGWGTAVCVVELPPAVRRRLLSADAGNVLSIARRLYVTIADGCKKSKENIELLSSYGMFSWDEWQMQVRGTVEGDLPSSILARLTAVASLPGSILLWSKYLSLRQQVKQEGLGDFVAVLESGKIPSAYLASAFEFSAYQSIGKAIYQAHPELSRFDGVAHDNVRAKYRALDAEIISLTGRYFASQINMETQVPDGRCGATVGDYTEMKLLQREIHKRRGHIPIRQLLRRAGAALQALKPCFMMGPLSVAQYLEQSALKFDLVVMDEASQLRPEEAIGAIARGMQLVVVGDPKQLPPTSFFDRMVDGTTEDEEDEAPAVVSGMESILDICQQLFSPVRSLRWHYRSHHESLIAFSNHHFYKNLIVFPSPHAKNPSLGVKYHYVRGSVYKERQNILEAQRVVDAIVEHMCKHKDESLGVVTLNQTQRELIEELLDKKLKTFSECVKFMDSWEANGWPFFVKNLENVQGDERDVIFISTTFGKAPGTDRVRQNFGPISRSDGWRRLNVLFTRSKRRIELFTSMASEDIVVDDRTPLGTKALRDYLDFAKRGILVSTDENERDPDSDFEVSVAKVVTSMGYEVKPQLGVAGFFIDMAVRNPDKPGEFLVGIECDGATYHSGFSVRDRDRIRQEILESLGWKDRIYRIWSTDWFYDPRRAIDRLRAFFEDRRRLSVIEGRAVGR